MLKRFSDLTSARVHQIVIPDYRELTSISKVAFSSIMFSLNFVKIGHVDRKLNGKTHRRYDNCRVLLFALRKGSSLKRFTHRKRNGHNKLPNPGLQQESEGCRDIRRYSHGYEVKNICEKLVIVREVADNLCLELKAKCYECDRECF